MKRERKDKHFIKKPTYPGGLKAMREFITKNLKYPPEALEYRKEGIVRVKYDVDYKGKVTEVFILGGMGYGCDEEAERLVRMLKFDVEKTRKMKVVFHKTINIKFKLPPVKVSKPKPPEVPRIETIQYNYVTTKKQVPQPVEKKKSITYSYTLKINK